MELPDRATVLRTRARAISAIRHWFETNGYLEVLTPTIVQSPAMEANLYAFKAANGFLRTSPEFALKKALAEGLGRIYELGPCYRAKESGPWHQSEFTMLEWYRAGASIWDLMDEVESLFEQVAIALQAQPIQRWNRVSVRSLFLRHLSIDLAHASTEDLSEQDPSWNDAFFRRWVDDIEPTLTKPTFVHGWPASQAALASIREDDTWPYAERFEVFVGGIELGNAFQELTHSGEQLHRCRSENLIRTGRGEPAHPIDPQFIEAVGRMPRAAGIAVGFDRLVAALCNWPGIA